MKSKSIILMFILSMVFVAVVSIYSTLYILNNLNQENQNQNTEKEIKFTPLQIRSDHDIFEKQTKVIKSAEEWSSLWTEMFPTEMIASAINFNEKMLIVVFQGRKSNGGYSIGITKIIENQNEIEVFVNEVSPGQYCLTTQAFVSSFQIVEIKKSEKPVKFTESQEITQC